MCVAIAAIAGADEYDSPEWKEEIAKGHLPYRKLTMEDFPVNDRGPSPPLMKTESFFNYQVKVKGTQKDGEAVAEVTEFTVRSGFDQSQSWRRPGVDNIPDMLVHEQGHLDISELHAYAFRHSTLPKGTGTTRKTAIEDLKAKMEALSKRHIEEARAEQELYDKETNHGMNTVQQRRWNQAIAMRLRDCKIVYWDKAG